MILLPDRPDRLIEPVEVADTIPLTLRTTSPTACCPSCGTLCSRVQSRYTRPLHDLAESRACSHALHSATSLLLSQADLSTKALCGTASRAWSSSRPPEETRAQSPV